MGSTRKWKQKVVVLETPETAEHVIPFIEKEISRKTWIYEVINGVKEKEQVLFESDEFMILPDTDAQNHGRVLNWLVIFKDLRLRRLRDLTGSDLSLLRGVRAKLMELVSPRDTMLYFHNPPSVWQLHLHVAAPCDVLRTTNDMQKVQFLDDIISNLEIDSDYYRKATMTYVLPVGHELIKMMRQE